MSTPKKIRANYEITFKRLVSTSPASKKFRQFLSSLRSSAQSFNLPITLADVRAQLTSPLKTLKKKPTRRKASKTAVKKAAGKKKAGKKTVKKKAAVKKTPARRRSRKKSK